MTRSDQPKLPTVAIVRQNGLSSASSRASVADTPVSRQIWWTQVVDGRPQVRLNSQHRIHRHVKLFFVGPVNVPNDYQRCSCCCWGSCCYEIFGVLKRFRNVSVSQPIVVKLRLLTGDNIHDYRTVSDFGCLAFSGNALVAINMLLCAGTG